MYYTVKSSYIFYIVMLNIITLSQSQKYIFYCGLFSYITFYLILYCGTIIEGGFTPQLKQQQLLKQMEEELSPQATTMEELEELAAVFADGVSAGVGGNVRNIRSRHGDEDDDSKIEQTIQGAQQQVFINQPQLEEAPRDPPESQPPPPPETQINTITITPTQAPLQQEISSKRIKISRKRGANALDEDDHTMENEQQWQDIPIQERKKFVRKNRRMINIDGIYRGCITIKQRDEENTLIELDEDQRRMLVKKVNLVQYRREMVGKQLRNPSQELEEIKEARENKAEENENEPTTTLLWQENGNNRRLLKSSDGYWRELRAYGNKWMKKKDVNYEMQCCDDYHRDVGYYDSRQLILYLPELHDKPWRDKEKEEFNNDKLKLVRHYDGYWRRGLIIGRNKSNGTHAIRLSNGDFTTSTENELKDYDPRDLDEKWDSDLLQDHNHQNQYMNKPRNIINN